jgi:hypothetical protein
VAATEADCELPARLISRTVTAEAVPGRIASVTISSPADRTPPLAATQPRGQLTVALLIA